VVFSILYHGGFLDSLKNELKALTTTTKPDTINRGKDISLRQIFLFDEVSPNPRPLKIILKIMVQFFGNVDNY